MLFLKHILKKSTCSGFCETVQLQQCAYNTLDDLCLAGVQASDLQTQLLITQDGKKRKKTQLFTCISVSHIQPDRPQLFSSSLVPEETGDFMHLLARNLSELQSACEAKSNSGQPDFIKYYEFCIQNQQPMKIFSHYNNSTLSPLFDKNRSEVMLIKTCKFAKLVCRYFWSIFMSGV